LKEISQTKEKIPKDVEEELHKVISSYLYMIIIGFAGGTLRHLAKWPVGYLEGWLITVRALQAREQARLEG